MNIRSITTLLTGIALSAAMVLSMTAPATATTATTATSPASVTASTADGMSSSPSVTARFDRTDIYSTAVTQNYLLKFQGFRGPVKAVVTIKGMPEQVLTAVTSGSVIPVTLGTATGAGTTCLRVDIKLTDTHKRWALVQGTGRYLS